MEHRVVKKDGSLRYVVERGHHIFDKDGIAIKSIGTVHDVTTLTKKDKELNQKLQRFIDAQNSLVVLTNGELISFANKKFLDFLGYKKLNQFLENHDCVCDLFIEDDRFFHLKKVNNNNWIKSILALSGRSRVVLINNSFNKPHAFNVSINLYDSQNYVVTFSDISDNMIEKLQLEHQISIDQLTNTFNRVYFNNNIQTIIQEHSFNNFLTGIIFFDIDFFKKINDKFGHDIGDYALKELVTLVKKYTRDDDKLIRWGGEEFIIVSQAQSINDVVKNAENLRNIVEHHKFKTIGKLTCSFGCAIHKNNNDILDTIKEADNALYSAKNSGRNKVKTL
jgi:diguanylate cyclase (GGDEF)-like protein